MSVTCQRVAILTLLAVAVQFLGLFLFVIGFFPVNPALNGVSGLESYEVGCHGSEKPMENIPPDRLRSLFVEKSEIPVQFDRVIFMVIDGLPAEFVLGKGTMPPTKLMMEAMPHTQFLLSNGKAVGFHAKGAPPTVTMPRLKAMTSGAIAGFLDVAYNFNTQALLDDNILGQLARAGWQMVMHGDETWLRLFPGLFIRQDGVSSFYVKDTIEVDTNVSRHIDDELISTDWDLLILHYLGLDHVGHTGGRASPLMTTKLLEMDKVIQKLYTSLVMNSSSTTKRTLLMVVSDHGMNDGGNHGGSSFEETDSLALFVPADASLNINSTPAHHYSAFQVDIVPTLALLLGVPIPKNSIGVLLPQLFYSLTDEQKLRALELNAWQLLRLLHARLSKLKCIISACNKEMYGENMEREEDSDQSDAKLCDLFQRAFFLHDSWRRQYSNKGRDQTKYVGDTNIAIEAYLEFSRAASELLSKGNTEKPMYFISIGGFLMFGSLLSFLRILFQVCKALDEVPECLVSRTDWKNAIELEKVIVIVGICFHVISLGASSLVEEEQYTWHFLLSTLCISFIHRDLQVWNCLPGKKFKFFWFMDSFSPSFKLDNTSYVTGLNCGTEKSSNVQNINTFQVVTILFVLVAARLLRAWHQGGVNWTHLMDISKWLDYSGPPVTKSLQILSVLLLVLMGFLFFLAVKPRKQIQVFVGTNILVSGFSIILFILWHRDQIMPSSDYWPTVMARIVYASLGLTALTTLLAFPWTISLDNYSTAVAYKIQKPDQIDDSELCYHVGLNDLEKGTKKCLHFVGVVYIFCWCLLQLLLQHPGNACPIIFLLLQLFAIVNYFYNARPYHKEWIMVNTMYLLGMSGHFGLGNSNTLATVDVAGAYIGLSTHSTAVSGILLFVITYGSPMLFLFGSMLCSPFKEASDNVSTNVKDKNSTHLYLKTIALPCVLPLALNSIVLTGFTGILLLMRNHLFVWSVFSPKYLYVGATTICIYIGTFLIAFTGLYSSFVIYVRCKSSSVWTKRKLP